MKTRKIDILIPIVISIILLLTKSSCDDIFEEDISNDTVWIYSPYDGMKTNNVDIDFWFEYINGATGYNLQVVSPSFEYPRKILADTDLIENRYLLTLYPDTFECRIFAFNGAYSTKTYTYASFIINDTTDLTEYAVSILLPKDNTITNKPEMVFRWEKLDYPAKYEIVIKKDNWQGVYAENTRDIENDSIVFTLEEGSYFWGIRAINEVNSKTEFAIQQFLIDTTATVIPQPEYPEKNDSITTFPFAFEWESSSNGGSETFDSIFISEEENFDDPEKYRTENMEYEVDELDFGTYYWKVRSYDLAGNKSGISETWIVHYVDTAQAILPGIPELRTPGDSTEITGFPLELTWRRGSNNGNILYDSLYIAEDTLYTQADKIRVNAERYEIDTLDVGTYFWKVKTNDVEGNQGQFSPSFRFFVK